MKGPDGLHLAASTTANGDITPIRKNSEARGRLQQVMGIGGLRPHPLATRIYGEFCAEEDSLLESIKAQGILTPLLITPKGLVISGRERLRVANELGLTEVPVRLFDLSDPAEIEEKVIESNVAREKTVEHKVSEYRELKRIEANKAAVRQGARNDLVEIFPEGEAGAARDLAAAKVGWSGRTADKGAKVLDAIDERAEAGDNMQDVEELRTTLNEQSVEAAYQKAVEFGWVDDARRRKAAQRGSTPERRLAGVYKQANTAVVKVATIFKREDVANFTPDQNRELRNALTPVLKWVDGLGRA